MLKQLLVTGAALAVLVACEERGTQPAAPGGGVTSPNGAPPSKAPSRPPATTPEPSRPEPAKPGATTPGQAPGAAAQIDQNFLKEAATTHLKEIEMGNLAVQKAQNPEVKSFAETLVQDHTKAQDRLKQFAQQHNVTLDDELDPQALVMRDQLQAMSGGAFDRQYLQMMVSDHSQAIARLERQLNSTQNPAVKQHIQQVLPTLRDHLQTGQRLLGQLGSGGEPGGGG